MPPRLLADRMLMRLGRWLRFAGYDVLIPEEMDDAGLIAAAAASDALLLTRDRGICARRGVKALYVESDALEEQLRQVVGSIGRPSGAVVMSRCSLCNTVLKALSRDEMELLAEYREVPANVKEEHGEFWHCPACRKVYWRGTHYERIMRTLGDLEGERAPGITSSGPQAPPARG